MAKSAGYYDVDDFNNYKKKQGKCLPPRINVLAAACHIQAVFDAKKFTYGFMGGLPMLCLGYKREMPDLHIAYDDKDFKQLKSKLKSDYRVRLPTGVNPLLPFKILVWTGPEYKDQGCTIDASIEIDLVPSGSYGTPAAGGLTKNLILLGLKTASGKQMVFKSLNIQYLVATLLSYCKARDLLWDPRKDLLYLCKHEAAEVQHIRVRLNTKEVKELFLGTSFLSRLHVEDQRLCYRTLLDTEPPPIMAITPPAPQTLGPLQPEQRGLEQNSGARSPRSRYRNVSGQRSSSSGMSDHRIMKDARPQSMEQSQDLRQLSHIEGVRCVNSAKPQSVSAATAAKSARKSMPNLMAAHDIVPVLHASAQTIRKTTIQQQHYEMQVHASSQLEYGGGFQPAHMSSKNDMDDANQDLTLGRKTVTSRTDSTRTDPTGTPVQKIQSQQGSLHVVSPEGEDVPHQQYFEDKGAPPRERLHLVGAEGVYGALEKPQPTAQPQCQHPRHQSAPPHQTEPLFVFELDATSPSKATFIAELPANSIMPTPAEQHTTRSYGDPRHQATIRPSNPRTTSAPLNNGLLPASLIAGGPGIRAHRQSLSHTDSSDEPSFGFSTCQMNAYRYSSYALSQSVNPEALYALSEEAVVPTYKAYHPFVATDGLNRNDSVSSVYSPGHKRNTSNNSTASHDSNKLAKEYQELLNFEDGYGSG